jgi:hypothetical protein
MEDKDFKKKFPMLSKVQSSQKNKQTAASDKVKEIPIDEAVVAEPEPEQDDMKTMFARGILKCTNFSQELQALLSLANPDGGGGRDFIIIKKKTSIRFFLRHWVSRHFGS